MAEWISRHGTEDRKSLIKCANSLVMHYGQEAGALSCRMYDKTVAAQGQNLNEAEMAELPTYGEVAKAINGTLKESSTKIPGTVARLTKQIGADTTLKNAMRDGAQFAWIPGGGES